jgi:hypothetical protein
MQKQLSLLAVAAIFAASLSAQCLVTAGGTPVTLTPTTGFWPADDEGLSAPIALGFNFPVAGGTAATFSHVVIESNGVAFLTNGGPAVGAQGFGSQDMDGFAGDSPRIAAFWSDLEGANGGANYAVTTDASVPGVFTINWIEVNEFVQPGTLSAQARLFANGDVSFSYSGGIVIQGFQATVGISAGNGLTDVSTDLTALPMSTIGSLYENFPLGSFDLQGGTMFLAFSGTGYTAVQTCTGAPLAYNLQYGTGCYDVPAAGVYEDHADAAIASAALQGNALQVIPTGYGYTGLWLAGGASAYLAPTGAANVILTGDDGSVAVTLPSLMPSPKGPVSQVTVSGNAIVTLGGVGNNDGDFSPSGSDFVLGDATAFYAWHDYNETEGGDVKTELVGNLFCITFENVENYPTPFPPAAPVVNPGTMQFQLDLSTGACTMLWVTVDTDTTSTFGSSHLVGWKTTGVVTDNGSQVLATALPITTSENLVAMSLSAGPNPISTPVLGTNVVYTTDNMPEFAPGAGIYIGINILSLSTLPAPGVDLFFIGAPGCAALIGSLDVILNMVGVTSTQSVTLPIPAGIPVGTTIWSQSASLIAPNSLPNGQNAFGLTTSNGVETFISVN